MLASVSAHIARDNVHGAIKKHHDAAHEEQPAWVLLLTFALRAVDCVVRTYPLNRRRRRFLPMSVTARGHGSCAVVLCVSESHIVGILTVDAWMRCRWVVCFGGEEESAAGEQGGEERESRAGVRNWRWDVCVVRVRVDFVQTRGPLPFPRSTTRVSVV
jgi:hypothetical protein